MMVLRNKLEDLGKIKRVNRDEKGKIIIIMYTCFVTIITLFYTCIYRPRRVSKYALQTCTECGCFHQHQVSVTVILQQ